MNKMISAGLALGCLATIACSDSKPEQSAPNTTQSTPASPVASAPSSAPAKPTAMALNSAHVIFHGSWWCVQPDDSVPADGIAGLAVCQADAAHDRAKAGHGAVTILKVNGNWCVRGEGPNGGRGLSAEGANATPGQPGHGRRGIPGCDGGAKPDAVVKD